jgi:hypothetical protein
MINQTYFIKRRDDILEDLENLDHNGEVINPGLVFLSDEERYCFIQTISESDLIEIIDSNFKGVNRKTISPGKFNDKTLTYIKNIFKNDIQINKMIKSYINGLLINTLHINSNDLIQKEAQYSVYKEIINNLIN